MQRATVVFPQPLSPTRPRVSPFLMEKLTSSTALTWATVFLMSPRVTGKYIFRWLTSKSIVSDKKHTSLFGDIGIAGSIVQPADQFQLRPGFFPADISAFEAPRVEGTAGRHVA